MSKPVNTIFEWPIAAAAETGADGVWLRLLPAGVFTLRDGRGPYDTGGRADLQAIVDRSLKHASATELNPVERLMQLKPMRGRMHGAESDIDFFVAHELQEVVPSAVTGEEDATADDGTPIYQQVDKSAIIPLLTAVLQRALERIDELEQRVKAR